MQNRTNWKTRARAGEEGASLLEVAIVSMIIATVVAIALPSFANSIRSYNLRSAATRIAQRMAGARALAMAKNKNVTVSFATAGGGNVTQFGYDFSPAVPDGTPDTSDPDDLLASYYTEAPPSGITVTIASGGTALTNGTGVTYTSRGELPIAALPADIRVSNSSSILTVSVNLRGQVWIH